MINNPIILTREEQEEAIRFFQHLGTNIKKETIRVYYGAFKTLKKEYGIRLLTQEEVNEFLTRHTNTTYRAFLKNYIEYKEWSVKVPKRRGTQEKKLTDTMSEEEQAQFLERTILMSKNPAYPLCFALIGECALRESEALAVRKGDFKLAVWSKDLTQNKNSPCELKVKGKGYKERIVIVSKDLMSALYRHMKDMADDEKLFKFNSKALWRKCNDVCYSLGFLKTNGKAKFHPHSLRHTMTTRWYEQGVDIVELRDRLGHVSVATTQLYINPDKETAIRKWKESLK